MNHFANRLRMILLALACSASLITPAVQAADDESLAYRVRYKLAPIPDSNKIAVSMTVRQDRELLLEVRFRRGPQITSVEADGRNIGTDDQIVWQPGPSGGTLRWTVELGVERNGKGFDALLRDDWGIFRAEDVIPRAATRAVQDAYSKTTMQFDLPDRWAMVTAYPLVNNRFIVKKDYRRFDQPDGWIAIGRLGIRRETIANMEVAVAGPTGQSVQRMEILALLNWTLPELSRAIGDLPDHLTIVSAGDPMWRGGLSGPNSLYLHADRPMISENSTSPLLHEVMHSILRISAADGYDWIVEGIAEYYSLELLRRSGTITQSRYQKAMQFQENWSGSADSLCRSASTGATTALAVTVMAALDSEIQERSSNSASLDNVVSTLMQNPRKISLAAMQAIVEDLLNSESVTLRLDKLPGCRSIQSNAEKTS